MRAREPDLAGAVDNEGVSIHYEVFGSGPVTVFLMPTFPIVDSRMWKAQVPYLARHFRVVTADPRGHGRSDRPQDPAAYGDDAYASDVIAVLDATGTESAFLVSLCLGTKWAVMVAAAAPDRVRGLVSLGTGLGALAPETSTVEEIDDPRWVDDYPGWAEHHSEHMVPERYSTKVYDDLVEWALDTDAATLGARFASPKRLTEESEVVRVADRTELPGARHARHGGRLPEPRARHPLRRAGRRPPGRHRGRRTPGDGASPRARQHADQGVRRHAHRRPLAAP